MTKGPDQNCGTAIYIAAVTSHALYILEQLNHCNIKIWLLFKINCFPILALQSIEELKPHVAP